MQEVSSFLPDVERLGLDEAHRRLLVSSRDGLAVISLVGEGVIARSFPIGPGDVTISNDGSMIGHDDLLAASAELWRISGRVARRVKLEARRPLLFGLLVGDSTPLALFDEVAGISMIDPRTGRTLLRFDDWSPANWLLGYNQSKDGRFVAWGGIDGRVQVRSPSTGKVLFEFDDFKSGKSGVKNAVRGLDFDPLGKRLLATSNSGHAVVWDLATGKSTTITTASDDFIQAVFSPDGSLVASLAADGTVSMRDANTFQPTGVRFVGNTASDNLDLGPFFSPDGRFIVTTADGQARLWDTKSGAQIGTTFPSDLDYAPGVSPNLRWIVTGRSGRVIRWALDIGRWPTIACAAVGRNMTMEEWVRFGPSGEYVATCPQFPTPIDRKESGS